MKENNNSYIRFFNGALGLENADIFVNNQLVVTSLAYGTFSPFHQATAGVYSIEVHIMSEETNIVFSDLVSVMEGISYTIALAGSADGAAFAVIPLDLQKDIPRPNLRFVNLIPYDTVLDVDISNRQVVSGLLFKEYSEDIQIQPGTYPVQVFDSKNQKILEGSIFIQEGKVYLAMIVGNLEDGAYKPQIILGEDMPLA